MAIGATHGMKYWKGEKEIELSEKQQAVIDALKQSTNVAICYFIPVIGKPCTYYVDYKKEGHIIKATEIVGERSLKLPKAAKPTLDSLTRMKLLTYYERNQDKGIFTYYTLKEA